MKSIPKISKYCQVNWDNNEIQFPRLIAELEAIGVFTEQVIYCLACEMDLKESEVLELIERAQGNWDTIKGCMP